MESGFCPWNPIRRGVTIGVLFCVSWVIVMWLIRPHLFPTSGEWQHDEYFIGQNYCGSVDEDMGIQGDQTVVTDFAAYAVPPPWIGFGGYKKYRTMSDAKRQVEDWCR